MKTRILAAIIAAAASPLVFAQSDDCMSPTPISGGGIYAFDLTTATPSIGIPNGLCFQQAPVAPRDAWYCWTADCDGMVTISTCTATMVDTVVSIYPVGVGCTCPGDLAPLCCNDDGCGKQSNITCEVRCGDRYLIRLAAKASPIYTGDISFQCAGNPCDTPSYEPIVCAPCCGTRPPIVDSATVNFNPGAVSAGTNLRFGPSDPAVTLFDLGDQASAPIGVLQSWNTGRFSAPSWSMGSLGTVFGVVIDDVGDIFATHTIAYDFDSLGATGGAGSVYRLDGSTGVASEFIRLPNATGPGGVALSGLGQIDYSCATRMYYVSNFEDGRIYAIDASGAVQSTFDHASGTVTGALPAANLNEPNDAVGPVPLGERVWAVKAVDGRLVYSLWVEDIANQNPIRNNEIYSVALTASGLFVAGTTQFELSMPQTGIDVTQPVADIAFDSNCCMYTAERGMVGISETTPHQGRLLKFCASKNSWELAPETFSLGYSGATNSSGGVDIEGAPNDRVWSIGDALEINWATPNNIYGLIGFPSAGGDHSDSIMIDFDNVYSTQQKEQLGSIDLSCVDSSTTGCEFKTTDIDCRPQADGSFTYEWTVEITNNSPSTANLLILGSAAFAPNNVMVLNPPLAQGSSMIVNIPINAGNPGDVFCFTATLAASAKDECCTQEVCIELPDCTCFEYDAFVTDLPGNTQFGLSLSIVNLEPYTAEWLSFALAPGYAGSVSPSLLDISLPFGMGMSTIPVTVTSSLPAGSPIVVIVGIHSATFHPCCFREITLYVPAAAGSTTPGDVNADGIVNALDLAAVLGGWGGSGSSDVNGDGTTDAADLTIVLAYWS